MATATDFGGPYYQSAIRKQEEQRRALGQQPMGAAELAGITQGELGAKYEAVQKGQALRLQERGVVVSEEREKIAEEEAAMAKRAQRSQETGQAVSGVATGVSTVAGISTALAPTYGAAATGATGVAGTGIGGWISAVVAALCCWTFLEGEMLTLNVRRYRDAHYDKLTSSVSFGYRWMSTWLVPLMRKYSTIKLLVKWSILKPLASYADWYYGENYYGWMFYPAKTLWTNLWAIAGISIKGGVKWQAAG